MLFPLTEEVFANLPSFIMEKRNLRDGEARAAAWALV
jgi:hypothetical protein